MERLIPIVVFLAAAVMGAWLAPAWADAETVKTAAMFESSGVLDESSLGRVRTGFGPAPGMDEHDELRRKRPNSPDADPLALNRPDPLPRESLSTLPANRTPNTPPNQQRSVSPPPATNNPPVASNPPPTNNPPPAQSTTPSLGTVIINTVNTLLLRNGLLQ